MNVPRLLVRIKELRRCLDPEANRQKLLRLESDLANHGPYSTQKAEISGQDREAEASNRFCFVANPARNHAG